METAGRNVNELLKTYLPLCFQRRPLAAGQCLFAKEGYEKAYKLDLPESHASHAILRIHMC
jgi:hypothetical protein